MDIFKQFFPKESASSFKKHLKNILGFAPGNIALYKTALTHRSVREASDENNERLEYLGDAVLSAMVADYLFKRYPYREEGFLTEQEMHEAIELEKAHLLRQEHFFTRAESPITHA